MVHAMSQQNLQYGVRQARESAKATPVEKVCYSLHVKEQVLKDILLDFLLRAQGITLDGALSASVTITSQNGSAGSEYSAKITVEKPGTLPENPDDASLGDSEPLWKALKLLSESPNQEGALLAMKQLGTALIERGYQAHIDSLEAAALESPSFDDLLKTGINGSPATALARIAEIYGLSHGLAQYLPAESATVKHALRIRHLAQQYLESAGMTEGALTEYREGYPL